MLSRCSRIEYLTLKMDIVNGNALKIVRDAMKHLQVDNLTLSGLQRIDRESAYVFLLFLVQKLVLLNTEYTLIGIFIIASSFASSSLASEI